MYVYPIMNKHLFSSYLQGFLLIGMEAATPRGLARALDPGLSLAKEAAKALPSGKRPPQWKSTIFICLDCDMSL